MTAADLSAAHLADFWVCGEGPNLAGVVGLEIYGTVALLRSLAVASDEQGRGLGTMLLTHAEQVARQRGIAALCLLTPTAEAFFAQRGYTAFHARPRRQFCDRPLNSPRCVRRARSA